MILLLDDMDRFAVALVKRLKGGDCLAFSGELGAGKTTLAQAIARALGVSVPVVSPTFTIMNHYTTTHRIARLVHIDAYRITEADGRGLGLAEEIRSPDSLTIIEWPERILGLLPPNTIHLCLSVRSTNEREVILDPRFLTNSNSTSTMEALIDLF